MADPSVHVFDGKLYIYPSHDWESGIPEDDFGSHFAMKDYHVLSLEGKDPMTSPVKDHGVALKVEDIKWAGRHDNVFTRVVSAPGKALQRLTTEEPDDSMLEVAIKAIELVIPAEKGKDKW